MSFWGHDLGDLFGRGGVMMWPLLMFSIGALALALDRAFAHVRVARSYQAFIDGLQKRVEQGDLDSAADWAGTQPGPLAKTAKIYLSHRSESDDKLAGIVEREGSMAMEVLEQRQGALSVIAHLATLTGLLGTVIGLVAAFQQIEVAGGQVQPTDLAAGIWQALLTTVFGLGIAIPTYGAYHVFESRTERMARRMEYMVRYLDQWTGKKAAMPATPEET